MTYLEDGSGIVSGRCHYFCTAERPERCPYDLCQCECHQEGSEAAVRAAELDDRPRAALENIARDLEAEARPDVTELLAERYGPSPRRAA